MNKNNYFIGIYILIIGMLVVGYGVIDYYESFLQLLAIPEIGILFVWCVSCIIYYSVKEYFAKRT